MGQAFFHQDEAGLEVFPMFCQVRLVDPYSLGVVYWKTLNLCWKFQFIRNLKPTQYLVTIFGQQFHWLEFQIKIHGMVGKQCAFSSQNSGKSHFVLKQWFEFHFNSVDTLICSTC